MTSRRAANSAQNSAVLLSAVNAIVKCRTILCCQYERRRCGSAVVKGVGLPTVASDASGLDSGVHSRVYARVMSATEGSRQPSGLVKIGDLAAQAGVTPDTLRYYERVGLLPAPHRTRTGYRLYDGAIADRIGFIHKAQALGLTLEEIREVLKVAEGASPPCEHVRALLSRRLKEIQGRIAELQSLQRSLARTLARSRSLPLTRSCVCGIIESTAVPRHRMSRKTRKEKV